MGGCTTRFRSAIIGVALLVGLTPLVGHQDPLGEVHPLVVVSNRKFHVYYMDNTPSRFRTDGTPGTYLRIFDATGKNVSHRSAASSWPNDTQPRIPLPEPLTGHTRRLAGTDYIMPEWPRKHNGRPFYLVADTKSYVRKELQWPDSSVSEVSDFFVDQSSIVVLATRDKPPGSPGIADTDLWLFHFARASGSPVKFLRLGDPSSIYGMPRTSGLYSSNGILRVVWLEANPAEKSSTLHLGSYDLARSTFTDRPLPYPTDWNTSISIGVIGDVLCLAYHGVTPKLSIEFVDLRSK